MSDVFRFISLQFSKVIQVTGYVVLSLKTKSVFITKDLSLTSSKCYYIYKGKLLTLESNITALILLLKTNVTRHCAFKGTLSGWDYCILGQNSD